jgi:intracellular septation protein
MKIFFDLFPLLVFFVAWLVADIFYATGAAMIATTLQVIWSALRHRKVEKLLWINFGAILFFGSLTLLLHDKRFIMIKPTIVYWIIASALIIAHAGFGKNLIKVMMEAQFDAPDRLWKRWLFGWAAFFGVLGVVNLLVAWNFSEAVWATFKAFGGLTLTLALSIALVWSLMPYARNNEDKESPPQEGSRS